MVVLSPLGPNCNKHWLFPLSPIPQFSRRTACPYPSLGFRARSRTISIVLFELAQETSRPSPPSQATTNSRVPTRSTFYRHCTASDCDTMDLPSPNAPFRGMQRVASSSLVSTVLCNTEGSEIRGQSTWQQDALPQHRRGPVLGEKREFLCRSWARTRYLSHVTSWGKRPTAGSVG